MKYCSVKVALDPKSIKYALLRRDALNKSRFFASGLLLPSCVKRGDWDLRCTEVENHPTHELMASLVENDFVPGKSKSAMFEYYRKKGRYDRSAVAKAEKNTVAYCRKYNELYSSLASSGYRAGMAGDEVGVAMSRNGTVIKDSNGHHRFALARLLGISEVVAEVRFVHKSWLAGASRKKPAEERIRQKLMDSGFALFDTPAL